MQTYTEVLALLSLEARRYFTYLWENMPASDGDHYPPSLFGEFARHAEFLRSNMPWCGGLEEPLFLDYVLFHRVNDEDITFHRKLFYKLLSERVRRLPVHKAVLEVNRWCGEMASYGQRDDRTASPMAVYLNGVGRCGEESAFVVSALRSVGIPARQVYVPQWSHCDDNHAWVEAWCGDGWHFLGACEPEPILDRGWFNAAAARAVLVHTRRFARPGAPESPELHGELLERRGPALYYNQTKRYAGVRRYQFKVLHDSRPVSGAAVCVELLNGAELCTVVTLTTDERGIASGEFGAGSYNLRVRHALGHAEQLCNGLERTAFTVHLGSGLFLEQAWREFEFYAPTGGYQGTTLSGEQKRQRTQQIQWARIARTKRIDGFLKEGHGAMGESKLLLRAARGNFAEIADFLAADQNPLRRALLRGLPEKDLCDTQASVLEDHLQGAARFEGQYPQRIFEEALLCPRISAEKLTPWRTPLRGAYDGKIRGNYLQNPQRLWWDLNEIESRENYPNLFWPPESALNHSRWDGKSRDVLFVALLRSWGLPARLHPWDGSPEYWNGAEFCPVVMKGQALLTLRRDPSKLMEYNINWTIARKNGAEWQTLRVGGIPWNQDMLQLRLPLGRYRLLTSARLPNGNQRAARYDMDLREDCEIPLYLPEYQLRDSLASHSLPAFSASNGAGEQVMCPFAGGKKLLLWLAPVEEPTEHVLNELLEAQERITAPILAFLPDQQAACHPTLKKALAAYPNMKLLFGDWAYNIELIGRGLYCDPESPPLMVCCDREGKAVYAASGYNVSIVKLLTQILRLLQ